MKARAFVPALAGVFTLATSLSFAAAKVDGPPGIMPTTATLEQVETLNESARGTPGPGVHVEDWDVVEGGVPITIHYMRHRSDYFAVRKMGPITSARGTYQKQSWYQDENGLTIAQTKPIGAGVDEERTLVTVAAEGTALKVLGEVATPVAAYVVEGKPTDDVARWYFVEKSTGRVVRREYLDEGDHVVVTFDDFRARDGETRAWHRRVAYEGKEHGDTYALRSYETSADVPETAFQPPPNRRVFDVFPKGTTKVRLPAQFVDNQVFVQVNLGQRGVDLQLDSGSSNINLNRDVAKEMGFQLIGDRAIIPKMTIGSIELDDVVVTTLPYSQETGSGIKSMGLLGFDFLADAVVHVDYFNEIAEAYDPDAFNPGQIAGSMQIPVTLDDRVPIAPAEVGFAPGHFLLDTGSFASFVSASFAKKHPHAVEDRGAGSLSQAISHFQYAQGVSRQIRLRPVQVDRFLFGGTGFMHPLIYEDAEERPDYDYEDGLIGQDFLRFYDLYFDYIGSRIVIAPNKGLLKQSTSVKH